MKKETFFMRMSAASLMLIMTLCIIFSACSNDDDEYRNGLSFASRKTRAAAEIVMFEVESDSFPNTESKMGEIKANYTVAWTHGTVNHAYTSNIDLRNFVLTPESNSNIVKIINQEITNIHATWDMNSIFEFNNERVRIPYGFHVKALVSRRNKKNGVLYNDSVNELFNEEVLVPIKNIVYF